MDYSVLPITLTQEEKLNNIIGSHLVQCFIKVLGFLVLCPWVHCPVSQCIVVFGWIKG